jgi:ArsR family transcriptional regulator, arsenate/arsenite/antimonite-responsive transcriptional repressor
MDRQKIERVSKALADRTRLRILEAISSRDHMNCAQIVSMRGVTPATVSHHLRILQGAGLIACRRQGQFVHSKALPQALEAYAQELSGLAGKKKKTRALK